MCRIAKDSVRNVNIRNASLSFYRLRIIVLLGGLTVAVYLSRDRLAAPPLRDRQVVHWTSQPLRLASLDVNVRT